MNAVSEIVRTSDDVPAGWMQMASGKGVDLARPSPDVVDFNDIALHLSRIIRFTGAAPISVAHHSVLVSHLLPRQLRLHGLLHDAHEAYFGDDSTPKKNLLALVAPLAADILRDLKHRWDLAIWEAAGIDPPTAEMAVMIKQADHLALAIERRDLLNPPADEMTWKAWEWLPVPPVDVQIRPVSSEIACSVFLGHLGDCLWPRMRAGHA